MNYRVFKFSTKQQNRGKKKQTAIAFGYISIPQLHKLRNDNQLQKKSKACSASHRIALHSFSNIQKVILPGKECTATYL